MRSMIARLAVVSLALVGVVSCAGRLPPGEKPPGPPRKGDEAKTPDAAVRKRMTRLVVDASCRATIDDLIIVGKVGKKVGWLVEDQGCLTHRNWHIELQFETAWNSGDDKVVKIEPDEFEFVKIKERTPPTKDRGHPYKVYIVFPRLFGESERIPLIDPELQIEP